MINRIELWEGWYFYNGIIYDEAGNTYTKNDIKMSWLASELINETLGSKSKIKIMREELQRSNKKSLTLPTIALIWESPKYGVIEETYNLLKN